MIINSKNASLCRTMMTTLLLLIVLSAITHKASAQQNAAPIRSSEKNAILLAADGNTDVIIYHAADAPTSIRMAARELSRVLTAATGAKFAIRNEPSTPMICLGSNDSSIKAGLDGKSMPEEGFQILTRDGNVYIVGHDTRDDQRTARGGRSWGTSYGVSTFLEKAVGVRWLMPGRLGEVVPRQERLTIAPMNLREKPDFAYRALEVMCNDEVGQWGLHQKVEIPNGTLNAIHATEVDASADHAWARLMPEELRKQHPEWKAVTAVEDSYKFCTNQPEAVEAFTKNAIAWLDAHPERNIVSIAPSDGQNFCRCPKCAPMIEVDPHGLDSHTTIILRFYNQVAKKVASERPGKFVGALVYGKTMYPPKVPITLEPNVLLAWAPLNYYGLGLYKPRYAAEFESVASAWGTMSHNIVYHNYLHWHRSASEAPLAPSLSLLKIEIPTIKRAGYLGQCQAGVNWSSSAVTNYILVKQMWSAQVNVNALYDEWMTLAYGEAAPAMKQIHTLIDDGYRQYKAHREAFHFGDGVYEIRQNKLDDIYVPLLGPIEKAYLQADRAVLQPAQRQRLELFRRSMMVFRYQLANAGFAPMPQGSPFSCTEEQFNELPRLAEGDGAGFPLIMLGARSKPIAQRPANTPVIEQRSITVPRLPAGGKITLDGRIRAHEWKSAMRVEQFRVAGGTTRAYPPTVAWITRDDQTLFVAFDCQEPAMAKIDRLELPPNDMRLFDGNVVELIVGRGVNQKETFHFAVSPSGSFWAGIDIVPTSEFQWRSAVSINEDRWTAVMAIPLSQLGIVPGPEVTVKANLARTRVLPGESQSSAWNAVYKGFLDPANLGNWRME